MGKDDNGGLLSKVVRFVRNPGTNWSDLDQSAKEQDSSHDRQQLKEMVERKKANDFVRRREFDMLRKIRRQGSGDAHAPLVHASQFQSSLLQSKPAERELTIKKIDEIEAQMSMQWWKTKPRDGAQAAYIAGGAGMPASLHAPQVVPPAHPVAASQPSMPVASRVVPSRPVAGASAAPPMPMSSGPLRSNPPAERPVLEPLSWSDVPPKASPRPSAPVRPPAGVQQPGPAPVRAAVPAAPSQPAPVVRPQAPRPTLPPSGPVVAAAIKSAPLAPPPKPVPPAVAAPKPSLTQGTIDFDPMLASFTPAVPLAIEVGEIAHDPELEEASIRFANGDDAGAEAGLKEALSLTGGRIDHIDTWLTLFDLYRATGQQASFDAAAFDFATRFQRSAPQWFSMPDMVQELVAAKPTNNNSQAAHWVAPPLLVAKSLNTLRDVLARTPAPWRLDLSRLTGVELVVLPQLTQMLSDWAKQPVEIHLVGVDKLDALLETSAPSGDATAAPDWWHARMALLRVLARMDDFELAALNYCVTYEVSPPSWETPRCTCKTAATEAEERAGPVTIIGDPSELLAAKPGRDVGNSDFAASNFDSMLLPPMVVELSGSIAGDVSATLMTLEKKFSGTDTLTLSCSKLVRVDFAAAGTLLNWVSSLHTDGRQVQFKGVHRLIAGFFSVIGISDLSRVSVRVD